MPKYKLTQEAIVTWVYEFEAEDEVEAHHMYLDSNRDDHIVNEDMYFDEWEEIEE